MDTYVNTFFTKEECIEIINFCELNGKQFSYDPKSIWDCKRIYNDEFKNKIRDKFKELSNKNKLNLWFDFNHFNINDVNVSLTKYYDDRFLGLHLDSTSQFTTVIVLSDDFIGGDFATSKIIKETLDRFENLNEITTHKIKCGDGISFNGNKLYHGVLPVKKGTRYSLNVWMTDTNHKYLPLKESKTLL